VLNFVAKVAALAGVYSSRSIQTRETRPPCPIDGIPVGSISLRSRGSSINFRSCVEVDVATKENIAARYPAGTPAVAGSSSARERRWELSDGEGIAWVKSNDRPAGENAKIFAITRDLRLDGGGGNSCLAGRLVHSSRTSNQARSTGNRWNSTAWFIQRPSLPAQASSAHCRSRRNVLPAMIRTRDRRRTCV